MSIDPGNVTLLINAANGDIDDLSSANQAMMTELQDLIQNISPILGQMQGDWSSAWNDTQSTVQTAIGQMNQDFSGGVQALTDMVDTQIRSDQTAAGQFQ
jgi:uncharacterized protein YukE